MSHAHVMLLVGKALPGVPELKGVSVFIRGRKYRKYQCDHPECHELFWGTTRVRGHRFQYCSLKHHQEHRRQLYNARMRRWYLKKKLERLRMEYTKKDVRIVVRRLIGK